MTTTALAPTAEALLQRPYGGVSPYAPAGITDATRQGWLTQLQGQGAQYGPAQAYAAAMGQFAPGATQDFLSRLNSGQFGGNFNPWNPFLQSAISEANKTLGRDFRQQTMPDINAGAVSMGPGALGGSRAGVAEGLAKQGLADAMQRQTTNLASQGYQAGIGEMGQAQGRQNEMYRLGLTQLPQLYQQAYQAGLMPGQTQFGFGQTLAGIGGAQQAQNQGLADWYNTQYNQMQGYPDQRFNQWASQMAPILAGGVQQPINLQSTPPQPSTLGAALGGAGLGYGIYNAGQKQGWWGTQPSQPGPYTPASGGPAYTADQYRTWM